MYNFYYHAPKTGLKNYDASTELISLMYKCEDIEFDFWYEKLKELYDKFGQVKYTHYVTDKEKEEEVLQYKQKIIELEETNHKLQRAVDETTDYILQLDERLTDIVLNEGEEE